MHKLSLGLQYRRDPERLTLGALREMQRQIDRPVSWLTLRNRGIGLDGRPSAAERNVLLEYVPALRDTRGLTVYDIGANRGQHATALSKAAAVEMVIAFEPLPNEFATLRELAKTIPKIRPLNFALGSTNVTATMHVNDFAPSSSLLPMASTHVEQFPWTAKSSPLDVTVRRLDDVVDEFNLPLPNIVKMDVQGYEAEIILGGRASIAAAQWALVEVSNVFLYEGAPAFGDLYQLLLDLGFSFYTVTEELLSREGEVLQTNVLFRSRRGGSDY